MKLNKLKKLIPLFLLVSSIFVLAQINTTLTAEDKTIYKDESNISIPISLNNNDSIAGLQFDISYTTNLIYKNIQATSRMPNFSIEVNSSTPGLLKIAAIIPNEIDTGNGIILNLIFDINESATPGNYSTIPSEVKIANMNLQYAENNAVSGTLTIIADIDRDGIYDEDDFCPNTFGCSAYQGCSFGLKEWLSPITTEDEFDLQQGRTLPAKFSATNCSNNFYSDEGILVRVINETSEFNVYNASGEGDDYIRINETEEQYITNIHTNELNMLEGDYEVWADFSNGLEYGYEFEVIQNGPPDGKGKGKGPK